MTIGAGWDLAVAAPALAGVLRSATAGMSPPPTVYDRPPASFNPPAIVIGVADPVDYSTPAIGVDTAGEWSITVAVGVEGAFTADELIRTMRAGLTLDPTLGGVVQLCRATGSRNWRWVQLTGGDYLTGDLILECRM